LGQTKNNRQANARPALNERGSRLYASNVRYFRTHVEELETAMAGMLQILTYLLSFYLVVKGVEVLQIGLASARPNRTAPLAIGAATLVVCIIAAFSFSAMQDHQAQQMSRNINNPSN
jgi:hypothetical protein